MPQPKTLAQAFTPKPLGPSMESVTPLPPRAIPAENTSPLGGPLNAGLRAAGKLIYNAPAAAVNAVGLSPMAYNTGRTHEILDLGGQLSDMAEGALGEQPGQPFFNDQGRVAVNKDNLNTNYFVENTGEELGEVLLNRTPLGLAYGAVVELAGHYREKLKEGYQPDQALLAALTFGMGVGILDKIGVDRLFSKTPGFVMKIFSEIGTEGLESPLAGAVDRVVLGKEFDPTDVAVGSLNEMTAAGPSTAISVAAQHPPKRGDIDDLINSVFPEQPELAVAGTQAAIPGAPVPIGPQPGPQVAGTPQSPATGPKNAHPAPISTPDEGPGGALVSNVFAGQSGADRLNVSAEGKQVAQEDTTMRDSSSTASKLEQEGKSPMEIMELTGWRRMLDGNWAFEISDSGIEAIPEAFVSTPVNLDPYDTEAGKPRVEEGFYKLGEIIKHDALFAAYPGLKKIDVNLAISGDREPGYVSGYMNNDRGEMGITISKRFDPENPEHMENLLKVITHENNHYVQRQDGFDRGGSPAEFIIGSKPSTVKSIADKIPNELRERYDDAVYKNRWAKAHVNARVKKLKEVIAAEAQVRAAINVNKKRIASGTANEYVAERLADQEKVLNSLSKKSETLVAERADLQKAHANAAKVLRDIEKEFKATKTPRPDRLPKDFKPYDIYRAGTGELPSKEAELRMRMPADELAKTPAFNTTEDLTVADKFGETNLSPEADAKFREHVKTQHGKEAPDISHADVIPNQDKQIYQVKGDSLSVYPVSESVAPNTSSKIAAKEMGFDTDTVLYRGEHTTEGGEINTKSPSITLTPSAKVASIYAMSPNDSNDPGGNARVTQSYVKMKNPVMNSKDDPFIDFSQLESAIGRDATAEIFDRLNLVSEGFWDPDSSDDRNKWNKYENVPVSRWPKELQDEVYGMAHFVFDDPKSVELLKKAGYDGAIHGAYGEHDEEGDDYEVKVFSRDQVKSIYDNFSSDVKEIASANKHNRTKTSTPAATLRNYPNTIVKTKDGSTYQYGPHEPAQEAARKYMEDAGLEYKPPKRYVEIDKNLSEKIADEYEKMKHDPQDPEVKAAYQAMIDETLEQFKYILETGLDIDFIDPKNDPYAEGPFKAAQDVRENNHMAFFRTADGYGDEGDGSLDVNDNPMLAESGYTLGGKPLLVNDVFRVVHDYFGHIKNGASFRARGEENAWQAHASMYSPLARRAMTSETRGQNSWLNYGPHGEANRTAKTEDTVFAEQKIGLMPEWTGTEGLASGEKETTGLKPTQPGAGDEHTMGVTRGKRKQLKRAPPLSSADKKALNNAYNGENPPATPRKEIEAQVRQLRKDHPVSEGWEPAQLKINKNGKLEIPAIPYNFHLDKNTGLDTKATHAKRVKSMGRKITKDIKEIQRRAEAGDKAAKVMLKQAEWYSKVRAALRRDFGGSGDLIADTLGALSPQTGVPENWKDAMTAVQKFMRGDYDKEIEHFKKHVAAGKSLKGYLDDKLPKKPNGANYMLNGVNLLQAMAGTWTDIREGVQPKARNFSGNLIGRTNEATIDVWAARYLRRLNGDKRIPPKLEKGVTGSYGKGKSLGQEFGFAQEAFKRASQATGIDPDGLQAIAWFLEKEHWTKNDWTPKKGEGGSFDQEMQKAPVTGYTGGVSVQQGKMPGQAEMEKGRNALLDPLKKDDNVIIAKAQNTIGGYVGDVERSFDFEFSAKPNFNPEATIQNLAKFGKQENQKDVFLSRTLKPEEVAANTNARPGVAVFFNPGTSAQAMEKSLGSLQEMGVAGFTMVKDPRTGVTRGVRIQWVPEFSMRYDSDVLERYRKNPTAVLADAKKEAKKMAKALAKLDVEMGDIIESSAIEYYDTVAIGEEEYDGYIGQAKGGPQARGTDAGGNPGGDAGSRKGKPPVSIVEAVTRRARSLSEKSD